MSVVNRTTFQQLRHELGSAFDRILGYFREDGVQSLIAIEEGMRSRDAVALVRPAHTLKGEALQFGAEPLGLLAEKIEHGARHCVEIHEPPDDLLLLVARLRPLFQETLTAFPTIGPEPAAPPVEVSIVVTAHAAHTASYPARRISGGGGFGRRTGTIVGGA